MVKIRELSEKEKQKRQRTSKLTTIAQEVFSDEPKFKIISLPHSYDFRVCLEPPIELYVFQMLGNQIIIDNAESLKAAVRLAEEYEHRGESEFTVQKDYEEPTQA